MIPQVLGWAERMSIVRVMDFNPAVHVVQPDLNPAASELTSQIMSDPAVIIRAQAEVVIDPAMHSRGFDSGLRIRGESQIKRPVH